MAMLKHNENGIAVADLCQEHGLSQAQFYKWRSKFGGMDTSMIKRMKELEPQACLSYLSRAGAKPPY